MNKSIRDKMIESLIEDDIDTIINGEIAYLADILRDGMKGYKNYSLRELKEEFSARFQDTRKIF